MPKAKGGISSFRFTIGFSGFEEKGLEKYFNMKHEDPPNRKDPAWTNAKPGLYSLAGVILLEPIPSVAMLAEKIEDQTFLSANRCCYGSNS
ncbi:MAG: hypothetical protein DHS20C05_01990 [Hyphococcus sp.]|nr:MAG: hypothetical protein DHS20C05_01990 [Marinicaulis sp.]